MPKAASRPSVSIEMSITEARRDGPRWRVKAKLVFTNTGEAMVDLDKLSIGFGGRVSNHVFQVEHGGVEVPYQGEMAKRAPPGPEGFVHLKPGKSETVEVRLDESYGFPEQGGDFTAHFETANHFSKDDITLRSNAVHFELKR